MVKFEIGGEITVKELTEISHLSRKNLFDCIGGKEKHFRFSVNDYDAGKVKRYFKNIPCPFYAFTDDELYAFRPDLQMEETINMKATLSGTAGQAGAIKSYRLAKNPLPVLCIIKKRVAQW